MANAVAIDTRSPMAQPDGQWPCHSPLLFLHPISTMPGYAGPNWPFVSLTESFDIVASEYHRIEVPQLSPSPSTLRGRPSWAQLRVCVTIRFPLRSTVSSAWTLLSAGSPAHGKITEAHPAPQFANENLSSRLADASQAQRIGGLDHEHPLQVYDPGGADDLRPYDRGKEAPSKKLLHGSSPALSVALPISCVPDMHSARVNTTDKTAAVPYAAVAVPVGTTPVISAMITTVIVPVVTAAVPRSQFGTLARPSRQSSSSPSTGAQCEICSTALLSRSVEA